MKKRSPLRRAHDRITSLKLELDRINKILADTNDDLGKHRGFWVDELRLQINVNGAGQYYSPSQMIERLVKHLGRVKPWYW